MVGFHFINVNFFLAFLTLLIGLVPNANSLVGGEYTLAIFQYQVLSSYDKLSFIYLRGVHKYS